MFENPEYMTICPYDMLPVKVKLLKHFNISRLLAKQIFE